AFRLFNCRLSTFCYGPPPNPRLFPLRGRQGASGDEALCSSGNPLHCLASARQGRCRGSLRHHVFPARGAFRAAALDPAGGARRVWEPDDAAARKAPDRKSTRLNSSHVKISYAVFCLKKKKKKSSAIKHSEKKQQRS